MLDHRGSVESKILIVLPVIQVKYGYNYLSLTSWAQLPEPYSKQPGKQHCKQVIWY